MPLQPGKKYHATFDPAAFCGGSAPLLKRPDFLAIVASATLAITLARKSNGQVNGFVVEGETAGGHNAPPRGALQLNVAGEPVYGPRDVADLEKIRELGLPFWLAGSYGHPGKLA
jgi:nitronate monooxygenase